MDLAIAKSFSHIDVEDDDDYIELLIKVAREYIKNGVGGEAVKNGEVDENNPLVELLELNIICSLYEQRGYTIDGLNEKAQYTLQSIANQLRLGGED